MALSRGHAPTRARHGALNLLARATRARLTIRPAHLRPDWSYLLLPAHEQRLLRSMAVFVGGCTFEAVERIVGTPPLEGIASLLDKSLVRQDRQAQDTRLTMLETVRQYALEQLATSGELSDTQLRHAEYCVELAETAERELAGPNQVH